MPAPFIRSIAIMAAIAEALASGATLQGLLASGRFNYRSNGKGRCVYSGKKPGNHSGKIYPPYSTRECARRLRHAAARQST
jgi:hypothetical protein